MYTSPNWSNLLLYPSKIDVAVNAPMSGYITELLAEEEETVAVGQDLFKLEAGDAPAAG